MIFQDSEIDFQRQTPPKINRKMASKMACLNLSPFGLKIGHKIPLRRSQDAHMTPQDGFWLRFGGQLGAMLATFLGPRRPKRPPRRSQDASKTISRRLQDDLKTETGVPHRSRQGYPIRWFWHHFGTILEANLTLK